MSSTQTSAGAAESRSTAPPMRFEVTVLPVADVDRAKAFYQGLGWRLDADFPIDEHYRIVQFTPPGSPASIQFGIGLTTMAPGSAEGLYLIVDDIDAARAELLAHGADVSEPWHGRGLGTEGHQPGVDPEHTSYGSFATFEDPDGNAWLLQEIGVRLPGRVGGDVAELAALLRETAMRHHFFEQSAPPHDWSDWYAACLDARLRGSDADQAAAAADRYMAEAKDVVGSSSP